MVSDDLAITSEDFHRSGWKDIVVSLDDINYSAIWWAFRSAAQAAKDKGDPKVGEILEFLSSTCELLLHPENPTEPFGPFTVNGKRTPLPEFFHDADMVFFGSIVRDIDEPWLQARLSDILWIAQTPKNPDFAILAIDAYRKIPIDPQTWNHDSQRCWHRAIRLAIMLGSGAGKRLSKIEAEIISIFGKDTSGYESILFDLAMMLRKTQLGSQNAVDIAKKLEQAGKNIETEKNFLLAGDIFQESYKWNKKADTTDTAMKASEMLACCAESFVKEADRRTQPPHASFMAATGLLERAIQKYRSIPRSDRDALSVDKRLEELRLKMKKAQEKGMREMITIKSPSIDISERVENAKSIVRGKSLFEAMVAFSTLLAPVDVNKLKDQANKDLTTYIHPGIPAAYLAPDGRVVEKHSGINTDGSINEDTLRSRMIFLFQLYAGLNVQGTIIPALRILHQEHSIYEGDFVHLCGRSPIVPVDREGLFAKGLYAGYNFDFITAMHLLIPQVENMVRFFLKDMGIKTTSMDSQGIETENGLSALMELPEVEKIFGKDYSFSLRSLLCDRFGSNLRNEVAHGLVEEGQFYSLEAIYTWWLILHLVLNGLWRQLQKEQQQKQADETEKSEGENI